MMSNNSDIYSVRLYFDEGIEQFVMHLWNQLQRIGLEVPDTQKGQRPHITLGILKQLKLQVLNDVLLEYSNQMNCLKTQFNSIGIFPISGVLFLSPTIASNILQAYSSFQDIFQNLVFQQEDCFQNRGWDPHCTLSMNVQGEAFPRIINEIAKVGFPIRANILSVGVVRFHGNRIQPIAEYSFPRS